MYVKYVYVYILHYIILYYIVLYYTMYYIISYYIRLCYIMLYYVILCCIIIFCIILYYTLYIVLYYIICMYIYIYIHLHGGVTGSPWDSSTQLNQLTAGMSNRICRARWPRWGTKPQRLPNAPARLVLQSRARLCFCGVLWAVF